MLEIEDDYETEDYLYQCLREEMEEELKKQILLENEEQNLVEISEGIFIPKTLLSVL